MLVICGDDVSIISVVSPSGFINVSSLGSFSSVSYSSKRYNYSSNISIGSCHIQEYSKKKRWKKQK